jgi:hypothetical protein
MKALRPGRGLVLAIAGLLWTPAAHAASIPSLFRGIVVADSPVGVRVISVEADAPAALADLRAEDIIVRVQQADVRSIDEFSHLSTQLKGQATRIRVLVFRAGQRRELQLHAYSYPLLERWGVEFIPEYDLRFAEARVGAAYWQRLGRGFEEAGKPGEALNAYLNGLHLTPADAHLAAQAGVLWLQVTQQRLRERQLIEGLGALGQASAFLQRLFDYPLTTPQLIQLRDELKATLAALKQPLERSSPN